MHIRGHTEPECKLITGKFNPYNEEKFGKILEQVNTQVVEQFWARFNKLSGQTRTMSKRKIEWLYHHVMTTHNENRRYKLESECVKFIPIEEWQEYLLIKYMKEWQFENLDVI